MDEIMEGGNGIRHDANCLSSQVANGIADLGFCCETKSKTIRHSRNGVHVMLVLTRKENERIELTTADGGKIVIVVRKTSNNRVSLGITAARDVKIKRGELR